MLSGGRPSTPIARVTLGVMETGKRGEFDVVLEPREEALAAIKEAIEGYLESLEAHGDPVPRAEIERVTVGG